MKHIRHTVLTLSLFLNFVFLWQNWQRSRVVSVPDGDSIQLADGRRVRLLGIDAPERGRCMADQARTFLSGAVLGRHVRLKETVTDSYGRTLALVIREDLESWISYLFKHSDPFLNRTLLRAGLARNTFSVSSKSEYAAPLKQAAEEAKREKRGIWSDVCRSTEPPGGCLIKGNTRAGEKKYYLPGCRDYDAVIVDEAYGDAWFCTEKEAAAAGFTSACGR